MSKTTEEIEDEIQQINEKLNSPLLAEFNRLILQGKLNGLAKALNDKDCVLLNMYGDGVKFNEPVWYSCGKCEKCKRVSKTDPKKQLKKCWCDCGDELVSEEDYRTGMCRICRSLETGVEEIQNDQL